MWSKEQLERLRDAGGAAFWAAEDLWDMTPPDDVRELCEKASAHALAIKEISLQLKKIEDQA